MAAKKRFVSRKKRRFLWIFLGLFLILVLLLGISPAPIRSLVASFRINKPSSKTVLPVDIQKAIENEAVKELVQGYDYQHSDVAAEVDPEDIQIAQSQILADNPLYLFKKADRAVQEFFIFDALAKTQLILDHNSQETVETFLLLQKS